MINIAWSVADFHALPQLSMARAFVWSLDGWTRRRVSAFFLGIVTENLCGSASVRSRHDPSVAQTFKTRRELWRQTRH